MRFSQRFNFTGREREVFALLVAGEAQKEIAATLGISEPTVRFHAVNFYAKCGVSNQRELLAFYARTLQSEVDSRIRPNISIG
jgi:DNA-binding CsgD family transcriptional regulator